MIVFELPPDSQQVTLKAEDAKAFLKINIRNVSVVEILNSGKEEKGNIFQVTINIFSRLNAKI